MQFRQTQLKTLQVLALMVAGSLGLRLMFTSNEGEALLVLLRGAVALLGPFFLRLATLETVPAVGITYTVVLKLANTVRATFAPPLQVATVTAVYSMHRFLPTAAAVFGNMYFAIGMATWITVEGIGMFLFHRAAIPNAWPATLDDVFHAHDEDAWFDLGALIVDLSIVWVATALAIVIVNSNRQAITQLGEALAAREHFISNMVRLFFARATEPLRPCARFSSIVRTHRGVGRVH